METAGDTGRAFPPNASDFIAITIPPMLPIHIYSPTTHDVDEESNAKRITKDSTWLKAHLVKLPQENGA
jgi:hypothetical protein